MPFRKFLGELTYLDDGGGAKLSPWPWQMELAAALPLAKRIIILKARQLGLSWIMGAYSRHTAQERGAKCLLFSQTLPDAKKLLRKARFVHSRLPEGWQGEGDRSLTQLLEFPSRESYIEAFASTENAGRGVSAGRLVVMDEFAFHQWAEASLAAVDPIVEAGGQIVVVSTANGVGNPYAQLWAGAIARRGYVAPEPGPRGHTFGGRLWAAAKATPPEGWLAIFLPYDCRPGRTEAWREAKANEPGMTGWKLNQEYPRDCDEAFVQTGRPVFLKEHLDRLKAGLSEPLPVERWPQALREARTVSLGKQPLSCRFAPDALRVFTLPEAGHVYYSGADVAEGLEHGDFSDCSIFDRENDHEVASLHGHWAPDVYACLLDALYRLYPGMHAVERNNHGLTTLTTLQQLGTPGVYREVGQFDPTGSERREGKLGWLTSSVTKPMMIDELEQAIRLSGIHLSDALAFPELTFYQTKANGSTGAPEGQWDDRVISRAIAWQMRKQRAWKPQVF